MRFATPYWILIELFSLVGIAFENEDLVPLMRKSWNYLWEWLLKVSRV